MVRLSWITQVECKHRPVLTRELGKPQHRGGHVRTRHGERARLGTQGIPVFMPVLGLHSLAGEGSRHCQEEPSRASGGFPLLRCLRPSKTHLAPAACQALSLVVTGRTLMLFLSLLGWPGVTVAA